MTLSRETNVVLGADAVALALSLAALGGQIAAHGKALMP